MTKVKAKYKLKIKILIDEQEICIPFESDLDTVSNDVTARMVDHFKAEYDQPKTGAVLDAAIITGLSESTIWRWLRRRLRFGSKRKGPV